MHEQHVKDYSQIYLEKCNFNKHHQFFVVFTEVLRASRAWWKPRAIPRAEMTQLSVYIECDWICSMSEWLIFVLAPAHEQYSRR